MLSFLLIVVVVVASITGLIAYALGGTVQIGFFSGMVIGVSNTSDDVKVVDPETEEESLVIIKTINFYVVCLSVSIAWHDQI